MSNWCPKTDMRRVTLEALILCFLAFAVGLSLNFSMVFKAFSGKTMTSSVVDLGTSREAAISPGQADALPLPVMLEELDALLADGAVLVDARSRTAYADAHLQGALSLPLGDFDELLPVFKGKVPPVTTLIVYCSGFGCPDSFDLGVRLLKAGYQDVLVYEGGIPEWKDAGRPLEGGTR